MSQGPTGHRPGGLTALAVLNFVFGGLGCLGLLAIFALLSAANTLSGGALAQNAPPSAGLIYLSLLLSVVGVALLIASGVGYLGQKRFLGKTLGTVYGILGIVNTIIAYLITHDFGVMSIVGLIYPVLTLALLNTVFKDDFPNP